MSDKNKFKTMTDSNTWHPGEELAQVILDLRKLSTPDPENPFKSVSGWHWSKNPGWRAKYVSIQIDMRDGAFILKDRDGERISLEEIQAQKER